MLNPKFTKRVWRSGSRVGTEDQHPEPKTCRLGDIPQSLERQKASHESLRLACPVPTANTMAGGLPNNQIHALSCCPAVCMQTCGCVFRELRPHTQPPRNSNQRCHIQGLAFQRTSSPVPGLVRVAIRGCCKLLICVANFAWVRLHKRCIAGCYTLAPRVIIAFVIAPFKRPRTKHQWSA